MTLWNLVSTQRIREVKSKGVSTQLKRGGALLAWPPLFYYTFCYLYSQITLKSMINWVEHHNRSIIKNKGWSPFDLTTIISVTRRSRTDVVHLLTECLMVSIDLTDVTLVSDDTFRRLGTWVTHDHLSSVIESNRLDWCDPSEWWYL